MYSAPICHSRECDGVSSYVPNSTNGAAPAIQEISAQPEVTPHPYYSYILNVMDNDDVVALFTLQLSTRISLMCCPPTHRSFTYTGGAMLLLNLLRGFCMFLARAFKHHKEVRAAFKI